MLKVKFLLILLSALVMELSTASGDSSDYVLEFQVDNRQGDYSDQIINVVQCVSPDCATGTDGTLQTLNANQLSQIWRVMKNDGSGRHAVQAIAITAQDRSNPDDENWYRVCLLKTELLPSSFTIYPTWANTNGPCEIAKVNE